MSRIWDLRARFYDVCEGSQLRRGPHKAALFEGMSGRVLFEAIGTGVDIQHFPPGREIVAIDISDEMLLRARPRVERYRGRLDLVRMDAQELAFADDSFDTAVTSCTMCSVPDPLRALREIRRVLRPGGQLLMFEHVRSRNRVLGLVLDLMTLWTRLSGTEMSRDTLRNVELAGFDIGSVQSVYLDIIIAIRAVNRKIRANRAGLMGRRALHGASNG